MFTIQPTTPDDAPRIQELTQEFWGADFVVSRGHVYHPANLPGFLAMQAEEIVGLATYCIQGDECELVTIDSLIEGIGIGSGLVESIKEVARTAGCRRLWLITTNDNLSALRFYQKNGFHLVAVYSGAIEESRRLKPQIPLIGMNGIPIRDEIELEVVL